MGLVPASPRIPSLSKAPFPFPQPLAKVRMLGWGECVSRQLITQYRSELDRIHAASGGKREIVVREALKDLLKRLTKAQAAQLGDLLGRPSDCPGGI